MTLRCLHSLVSSWLEQQFWSYTPFFGRGEDDKFCIDLSHYSLDALKNDIHWMHHPFLRYHLLSSAPFSSSGENHHILISALSTIFTQHCFVAIQLCFHMMSLLYCVHLLIWSYPCFCHTSYPFTHCHPLFPTMLPTTIVYSILFPSNYHCSKLLQLSIWTLCSSQTSSHHPHLIHCLETIDVDCLPDN